MFDDHLVKNQALLDYKKRYLVKGPYCNFPKGGPYEFSPKLKNYSCLLLDEIRLEIMFDDHLVTNQALLDYKKAYLIKGKYWNFSKGGTPWI